MCFTLLVPPCKAVSFSRLMSNSLGFLFTGYVCYDEHKRFKYIKHHAQMNPAGKESDEATKQHVTNMLSQMPQVQQKDINALQLRVRNDDSASDPDASMQDNGILELCHFAIPEKGASLHADMERKQYMTLAHEMKHYYEQSSYKKHNGHRVGLVFGASWYPLFGYIIRGIERPVGYKLIYPAAITAFILQGICAEHAGKYVARREELKADGFALEQARSLADIKAYKNMYESELQECMSLDKNLMKQYTQTHPHPKKRIQFAQQYYAKRKAEGWTE